MEKDELSNPKNVKFDDLQKICTKYFGNPRIKGSHHIFKTSWKGEEIKPDENHENNEQIS